MRRVLSLVAVMRGGRSLSRVAPGGPGTPSPPQQRQLLPDMFQSSGGNLEESSSTAFEKLRNVKVVGVDAEGTHLKPPLLVQIAYGDGVIIESPRNAKLSSDLRELMANPDVVKVFFGPPGDENLGVRIENAVDVQEVAMEKWNLTQRPSLTDATSLALSLNVTKHRKLSRGWGFKNRRSKISPESKIQAAADAWVTLKLYNKLFRSST